MDQLGIYLGLTMIFLAVTASLRARQLQEEWRQVSLTYQTVC